MLRIQRFALPVRLVVVLGLVGTGPVFAKTVPVDVPGGGVVNVTERAKKVGTKFQHTVTVRSKDRTDVGTIGITKIISGEGLTITGGTGVTVTPEDTNGNGQNDKFTVTVALPVGGGAKDFTYSVSESLIGKKHTVTVTKGGVSSAPKQIETQSGQDGGKKPDRLPSGGRSVSYDASTSVLSFANDFVLDTGFSGDPVIGAAVILPSFKLLGMDDDDRYVFASLDGQRHALLEGPDLFLEASIDFLTYSKKLNLFSGDLFDLVLAGVDASSPFFDPALPAIASGGILAFAEDLNQPGVLPFFGFAPDRDFFALSGGFNESAESSGTDGNGALRVDEPLTVNLLGLALVTLVLGRLGARGWRGSRHSS